MIAVCDVGGRRDLADQQPPRLSFFIGLHRCHACVEAGQHFLGAGENRRMFGLFLLVEQDGAC